MKWYFTFGQRYRMEPHPKVGRLAHPDGWFTVEADSEAEARNKMAALCGLFWADCYDKEPSREMFKLGELHRL